MREVERQVMLRIIDQRWREHLEEMDYLKEGINLRAMGQKDPLTEWQREGYEMFGAMMKGIAQDFVRYVMHVQVVRNDPQPATVQNMQEESSDTELPSASTGPPTGVRRRRGRGAGGTVADRNHRWAGDAARAARARRPSRKRSSRTSGPRRHAMPRARAARARSSRCATAPADGAGLR